MYPAASALLPVQGLLIFSYYCIAPGERQDPTRSKETAKLCVLSVWSTKKGNSFVLTYIVQFNILQSGKCGFLLTLMVFFFALVAEAWKN